VRGFWFFCVVNALSCFFPALALCGMCACEILGSMLVILSILYIMSLDWF
jgi:hypothetical protein